MNLSRIGSQRVISADDTHITVLQLPGAHLNEMVTIETTDGQKLTGHITSLASDRCDIHICDNPNVLQRDHLTIWRQGGTSVMPREPELWIDGACTELMPFLTGVTPWDCLFPLNRGNRILVSGQTSHVADRAAMTLVRSALQDGQIPVCAATRPTQKEQRRLRQLWQTLGLDNENLFAAHDITSAYCVLQLIQDSLKRVVALASAGHDVCFVVTDIEAWFDLFCENLTLQGRFMSRKAMVSAFQGELCRCLDFLYRWRNRVTVLVVQPWLKRNVGSAGLQNLRCSFDVMLMSLADGSISLEGDVMTAPVTQKQQEAMLLRRQFKMLARQIQRYQLEAEDLPEDLEAFQNKLTIFLNHTDPQEDPVESNDMAWKLLQGVHEDRLLRLPLSLLRDRLSALLME